MFFLVDRLKSNTPKWHQPDGDLLTEWIKAVDSSIVVKKKNINNKLLQRLKFIVTDLKIMIKNHRN